VRPTASAAFEKLPSAMTCKKNSSCVISMWL
jgi:hypothetical protein